MSFKEGDMVIVICAEDSDAKYSNLQPGMVGFYCGSVKTCDEGEVCIVEFPKYYMNHCDDSKLHPVYSYQIKVLNADKSKFESVADFAYNLKYISSRYSYSLFKSVADFPYNLKYISSRYSYSLQDEISYASKRKISKEYDKQIYELIKKYSESLDRDTYIDIAAKLYSAGYFEGLSVGMYSFQKVLDKFKEGDVV